MMNTAVKIDILVDTYSIYYNIYILKIFFSVFQVTE